LGLGFGDLGAGHFYLNFIEIFVASLFTSALASEHHTYALTLFAETSLPMAAMKLAH
jgi:hypothetical protein